jgi:hypothetical protein
MWGARPAPTSPTAKTTRPVVSGGTGPDRSAHPPAMALANKPATPKAVEPPPYSGSPVRC